MIDTSLTSEVYSAFKVKKYEKKNHRGGQKKKSRLRTFAT